MMHPNPDHHIAQKYIAIGPASKRSQAIFKERLKSSAPSIQNWVTPFMHEVETLATQGFRVLLLPLANLQTLVFVMLVFSGQGTIYLVRERDHFWHSRPSPWMIIGTSVDILVVGLLATQGILMVPIPVSWVAGLLAIIGLYLILLDFIKVPIFSKLNLN